MDTKDGVESEDIVIEDISESNLQVSDSRSHDNTNQNKTLKTLSNIGDEIARPQPAPVFGNVSVKGSENVHFGNNTYFNGPVTIKQIIHNKTGMSNESYVKTDEENDHKKHEKLTKIEKKPVLQKWHKIAMSVLCLTLTVTLCCVFFLTTNEARNEQIISHNDVVTSDIFNYSVNDPLIIADFHLRIVDRSDWLAQPEEGVVDQIQHPIPLVVICHTATEHCQVQSECVARVRTIQTFHIESRRWFDIGYNFLIGGDGSAYTGRGFDKEGAHTKGYNNISLGIAFIGTYNNVPPNKHQLDACRKLLKLGVKLGKLSKDYKLLAHRQLMSTLSPGEELYNIIKTWPHFVNNMSDLLPVFKTS